MDRWSQLSLKDKSNLMSLYIQNGISSLEEIKKHYNSFAEGGQMSPDYPPFDDTTPKTKDTNDKEAKGRWHIHNAKSKGLDNSILIKAFNEAKSHGLSDQQAYEYVTDVAIKMGWSSQKPVQVSNASNNYPIAQVNYVSDNTYVEPKKNVQPKQQPAFVDYDKHQQELLIQRAEEEEAELQQCKDVATGMSLAGASIGRWNPLIGAMLQIPDIYMDAMYSKYPVSESTLSGMGEFATLLDNTRLGNMIENGLNRIPKYGKYLGPMYSMFRRVNDYAIPIGVANDATDLVTGNSIIDYIGGIQDTEDVNPMFHYATGGQMNTDGSKENKIRFN